ncbi:MAG TPA: hypothetical protein VEC16_04550 [Alphaproteobacteria bacterium]|nr:hypothetical protein [Alphaproteobacteria bacterium]
MDLEQLKISKELEEKRRKLKGGFLHRSLFDNVTNKLRGGIITLTLLAALIGVSVPKYANAQEKKEAIVHLAVQTKADIDNNIDSCKQAIFAKDKSLAVEKLNHLIKLSQNIESHDLVKIIDFLSDEINKLSSNRIDNKSYSINFKGNFSERNDHIFGELETNIKSSEISDEKKELCKKQIQNMISRKAKKDSLQIDFNTKNEFVKITVIADKT